MNNIVEAIKSKRFLEANKLIEQRLTDKLAVTLFEKKKAIASKMCLNELTGKGKIDDVINHQQGIVNRYRGGKRGYNKASNAFSKVSRALDIKDKIYRKKLNKEENLQELSAKTLDSYLDKATKRISLGKSDGQQSAGVRLAKNKLDRSKPTKKKFPYLKLYPGVHKQTTNARVLAKD